MLVIMENSCLRVEVDTYGAELTSILHKETGRECLWQADPAVWGRHAPVLFPYCGRLKDGRFWAEGREYRGEQHGFARDMPHKLVCKNRGVVVTRLETTPATLEKYPYQFALKTTYKLEGNRVLCKHKVISYSDVPMYFSIGFHTGLRCPFVPGTRAEGYRVVFEKEEAPIRFSQGSDGFISPREERAGIPKGGIPITPGVFADSLILQGVESSYIQLEEESSGEYIRIRGADSPYTVLWSAPQDTRVVCIEPWYGMGDFSDASGRLEEKRGIRRLLPREEFGCSQTIEIGLGKNRA